MKMKSKLFGFGAKSALYLLAICGALFTSCYEKEEIDVTPPVVLPDAAYVIVGNVYFAKKGEPVANKQLIDDPLHFRSTKVDVTTPPGFKLEKAFRFGINNRINLVG